MTKGWAGKHEGPEPPLLERLRMPLRIASVFVGYVIYLVVPGPLVARVLLWAGFIALDWAIVDQVTRSGGSRPSPAVVGQGLLGLALLAAGVILLVV